jgi:5-methylcytosine-specific restriction endonuclease McrA
MKNIEIKKKLIERDGLRCSVTGEKFDNPDDLSIEHLKPVSKGGTSDLDNLVLVLNRDIQNKLLNRDIQNSST